MSSLPSLWELGSLVLIGLVMMAIVGVMDEYCKDTRRIDKGVTAVGLTGGILCLLSVLCIVAKGCYALFVWIVR